MGKSSKPLKEVLVRLEDRAIAEEVQTELSKLGFETQNMLDAVRVLTGKLPESKFSAARKVKGVRALEESRQVKAT